MKSVGNSTVGTSVCKGVLKMWFAVVGGVVLAQIVFFERCGLKTATVSIDPFPPSLVPSGLRELFAGSGLKRV